MRNLKNLLSLIIIISVIGCGVVRDNPVDKKGGKYELPSIEILSSNIEGNGICYDSTVSLLFSGNSEHNLFQYFLDNELLADWSESGNYEVDAGSVGPHVIKVKTKYYNGIDIDSISVKYFVLSNSAVYLSPPWIDTTKTASVELNCEKVPSEVVALHLELTGAKINYVIKYDTTNVNMNILHDSSTVDISILPEGKPIAGSMSIATLELVGFSDSAVSIIVDMRDEENNTVAVDSVFGGIYE